MGAVWREGHLGDCQGVRDQGLPHMGPRGCVPNPYACPLLRLSLCHIPTCRNNLFSRYQLLTRDMMTKAYSSKLKERTVFTNKQYHLHVIIAHDYCIASYSSRAMFTANGLHTIIAYDYYIELHASLHITTLASMKSLQ